MNNPQRSNEDATIDASRNDDRVNVDNESVSGIQQRRESNDDMQQQQQQQQQQDQIQQPDHRQQQQMALETQAVEDLLTREMMQLSLKDRNDIQEEIHGVKCLAPLETTEFLERSIAELDAQLQTIILSSFNVSTEALLLAKSLGNESYVNDDEFKLRFLRCELFDVQAAALRLCEYLNQVRSLFGDHALQRELQLQKDFTREEIRDFRKGYFQLLPFRDRSGRKILIVFPRDEHHKLPVEVRFKIICYMSTVATTDDIETQRNGFVIILWFDSNFKGSYETMRPLREIPIQRCWSWGCARASAIHVCTPDTPFFRFRRSAMVLQVNKQQRSRIKFHVGKPVELHYSLQSYGIPTENIPMTWSGTIKDAYLKNWMKLRKAIEDDREAMRRHMIRFQSPGFQSISGIASPYKSVMSNVVECPNSNDVAFRQGTSLYCHPGNVRFRSLVESSVVKLRESSKSRSEMIQNLRKQDDDTAISSLFLTVPISSLVSEIINQIIDKDKGRVLVWTSNHNGMKYGCWCTITSEDQIASKIEYTVREFIRGGGGTETGGTSSQESSTVLTRAENQESNRQTSDSSTSVFRFEGAGPSKSRSLTGNPLPTAASMPNKRARISGDNTDNDAFYYGDVSSSDDERGCQLFCKKP